MGGVTFDYLMTRSYSVGMNTRGETRLCSITYSQLSDWTRLSVRTVRNLASRRVFNRKDVLSTLEWANTRRAKLGLPPVGVAGDSVDSTPIKPVQSTITPDSNYNPTTGEYKD